LVRHPILTIGGVIVGLVLVSSIFNLGGDRSSTVAAGPTSAVPSGTPSTTPTPVGRTAQPRETQRSKETQPAKKVAQAGIGDPVTDGPLRFTVKSVRCGVTRIGDAYLNKKPQGQFCLVSIKVKNVSNQPTTFDGDNQTMINRQGQEFSSNVEAGLYLEDANTFLEEINPGNQLTGTIVFDVPKKTKPAKLLLKSGVWGFSDGVTVYL
jgi:hypothetical protein